MTFIKKEDKGAWRGEKSLPLTDVPPVLLAQSHADYAKIGKATEGFCSDWKRYVTF